MTFGHAGYLSIAEIILYVPALIAAIYTTMRHGFRRSGGWVFTVVLCLIRIIGAACQLCTYSNNSSNLLEAVLILDSIGISPLLFATLGVLSRFVDFANASGRQVLGVKEFRIVQLFITVAVILSIVGGTSSTYTDGHVEIPTTSKVGIILYFVAFVGISLIWTLSVPHRSCVPSRERWSPVSVAVALPLIAVRLLYSALSVFLHNHTFSVVNGSVAVRAGMATAEEWVIVVLYICLGFYLYRLEDNRQGIAGRPWKGNRRGRA